MRHQQESDARCVTLEVFRKPSFILKLFYQGVAPNADFVTVKAFNQDGTGTYLDVIKGIDWIMQHRDDYGIRVLNLSFSAPARSHYWDDPLNQAVMAAWQAGIVVVASAGNTGPDPMTIGVPGNVPYVVTVGAMSDNYSPHNPTDDFLASFSSAGPTAERFVKPELVAPGGHMLAWMPPHGTIAQAHPEFIDPDEEYFTMSGTSQSAAVVTGVVALMLQRDPSLTPDNVKCRLMAGAHPAMTEKGNLGYSVFQQGAGLVNAHDAIYNSAYGCANVGLDIGSDLSGKAHFAGSARVDENGNFYIEGLDSFLWNNSMLWNSSFLWSNSMLWNNSFLWNNSMLWNSSFLWNNSELFNDSFLWNSSMLWNSSELSRDSFLWNNSLAEPMNINTWVKPE